MFRVVSEDALRAAFRPKDAAVFEPPPGVKYPFGVIDYLAWVHPAGGRVYLLFAVPGGTPTGVAFQNNGGSAVAVAQMCDWCHTIGSGTEIAMLTAQLNANKRLGVNLCSDLSCARKLEDQANLSGRSPRPALRALVDRIGAFARDGLKIDLFRP
jgi:hypothetical protein